MSSKTAESLATCLVAQQKPLVPRSLENKLALITGASRGKSLVNYEWSCDNVIKVLELPLLGISHQKGRL
jgi:hypothetical protein